MAANLSSKQCLALIENFRSPDGVRAHVFKSNLGGDAIVVIEADTAGGDEAEVTLNVSEVMALHAWLGRALGSPAETGCSGGPDRRDDELLRLRKQMGEIAVLLLQNDRDEVMAWARGVKLHFPDGAPELVAEPSPCEHLRSELLAEKNREGQPLFEMHKCLDCKVIFRVRSSVKSEPESTGCGPQTPWDCLCGEPSCPYCGTNIRGDAS